MRFKHALLAAGALFVMVAPGAQAATGITYSATGSYANNQCENQIDCTSTYSYTGSASCAQNCVAGAPTDGTFTLSLTSSPLHPPGPCVSKRVQGTLEVAWSDATTTTASLTGRARHGGYALKGTITGGTNPFYHPPSPIKGFVSHPPSPCLGGSFAGSLKFFPSAPA